MASLSRYSLPALVLLVFCLHLEAIDAPCLTMAGTCQDDHEPCEGTFITGHCSGGSHRRCCVTPFAIDIGDGVKIYARESWGALEPKHIDLFKKPASLFFIHHTAADSCHDFDTCVTVLKGIQNFHMDTRGWADIGYSFLVGQDGQIYEGRGWDHLGAHTLNHNNESYAASFMGNYMDHLPNNASLNAARMLIEYGVSKGFISSTYHLYGHRDGIESNTVCPGDALYSIIQTWPHYNHVKPQRKHKGDNIRK